jgi:predicted O-methyltransferase YrrM
MMVPSRMPQASRLEQAGRRALRPAAIAYNDVRGVTWRAQKRLQRRCWRHYHLRRHGASYASTLEHVRTRDQLPMLLESRSLVGDGVEVGVQRGRYSEYLLAHWPGRRLISVDPWRESADGYVDSANVDQVEQDRRFHETWSRLRRFGVRSEIWRTTSLAAAARIALGTLDFVYLDARHDRDSVLADLEAWWPKLRPGGIIAGHDYVDGVLPNGVFGVRSAVDAFFHALRLPVHSTQGSPRAVETFPSWIVCSPTATVPDTP